MLRLRGQAIEVVEDGLVRFFVRWLGIFRSVFPRVRPGSGTDYPKHHNSSFSQPSPRKQVQRFKDGPLESRWFALGRQVSGPSLGWSFYRLIEQSLRSESTQQSLPLHLDVLSPIQDANAYNPGPAALDQLFE